MPLGPNKKKLLKKLKPRRAIRAMFRLVSSERDYDLSVRFVLSNYCNFSLAVG